MIRHSCHIADARVLNAGVLGSPKTRWPRTGLDSGIVGVRHAQRFYTSHSLSDPLLQSRSHARNSKDPSLAESLLALLRETRFAAVRLEIEFSEHASLNGDARALATIRNPSARVFECNWVTSKPGTRRSASSRDAVRLHQESIVISSPCYAAMSTATQERTSLRRPSGQLPVRADKPDRAPGST